jgi:hypothetical protein
MAQDHAGRTARLHRFAPAGCTQAPAVAGPQAGKAELGHRRRKIIAAGFGELEKRRGHDGADRVAADVFSIGVAATVTKYVCNAAAASKRSAKLSLDRPATSRSRLGVSRRTDDMLKSTRARGESHKRVASPMSRGHATCRLGRACCLGHQTEEINGADNCDVEISARLVFPV